MKSSAPKSVAVPSDKFPAAAARRLLEALSQSGAYGFEDRSGARARISVAAARKGVSVHVASAPASAAASLCAADLALWSQPDAGGRARLTITSNGRAACARRNTPAGLDGVTAQHLSVTRRPADASPDAPEVYVNRGESPFAWLATRKGRDGRPLIDAGELEAGERLRRDLTLGQMLPRVTASWSATRGAGAGADAGLNFSDLTIAARQRVDQALRAAGPELAGLLVDVCGFLKGLDQIEMERGWPQRSAKVVLVLALRQLCRHYGVGAQAVGPHASRGVRHWGVDDFRPSLTGAPE